VGHVQPAGDAVFGFAGRDRQPIEVGRHRVGERLAVEPGAAVAAGQPLVWLEAMKMEHAVHAPAAGVVTALPVAVGPQVVQGTPLAVGAAAG
jgi:biotin carboxyl carrier protein